MGNQQLAPSVLAESGVKAIAGDADTTFPNGSRPASLRAAQRQHVFDRG